MQAVLYMEWTLRDISFYLRGGGRSKSLERKLPNVFTVMGQIELNHISVREAASNLMCFWIYNCWWGCISIDTMIADMDLYVNVTCHHTLSTCFKRCIDNDFNVRFGILLMNSWWNLWIWLKSVFFSFLVCKRNRAKYYQKACLVLMLNTMFLTLGVIIPLDK